jgi:hypothetical protein
VKFENARYLLAQNLLSSSLLCKNIKTYRSIILHVLYGVKLVLRIEGVTQAEVVQEQCADEGIWA